MHLNLSTTFHLQTNGQSERTIQIFKDMLSSYALDFGRGLSNYLLLIAFSYNNNYHTSIQMTPFEALYRRGCRSPIGWFEMGEIKILEPDLV